MTEAEAEAENVLITNKHILVIDSNIDVNVEYIRGNFCGRVCGDIKDIDKFVTNSDTIIYLCGDIEKNYDLIPNNTKYRINIIKELSYNYDLDSQKYKIITLGQVPANTHNVGVYFRDIFGPRESYFERIKAAHQFQQLTESNKPSNAFRTGIYLTNVIQNQNEIKFKLLRCSSNLNGPTDNFREPDLEVIDTVNNVVADFFEQKVVFNHVLAQIYENKVIETNKSKHVERKAKIMAHSDKTKDMPRNGLIAFTTFYDGLKDSIDIKKFKTNPDEHCYYDTSILTRLRFRLKKDVNVLDNTLKGQFDIILYPNSVFIISLGMNRLYTHEIVPSILPIDKIPTRMGYVIRCSNTNAVFKDNQTYIDQDGKLIALEEPNGVGVKELKDAYFRENTTIDIMEYGEVNFSLNRGDYERPIL